MFLIILQIKKSYVR